LRRTAKSFGLAKIRVMQLEAAVGQVPPGDGSWPVNAGLAKAFR
jgi:Rod binding domain-containing protein